LDGAGGLQVEDKIETLSDGLIRISSFTETKRKQMGRKGWKLAKDKYRSSVVSKKLLRLYKAAISSNQKQKTMDLRIFS
jgi:hypothetical protein